MTLRPTIDKAGKIALPKRMRKELRQVPGMKPLAREHGIWVFRGGKSIAASAAVEVLRQIRVERDLANFGKVG